MANKVVFQLPTLAPNEISYWENKLTVEKMLVGVGKEQPFFS